jgi:hypothetical protein
MSVAQHSITETFIHDSDNLITLTLNENGVPISGAWDELAIYIGRPAVVILTRTSSSNGISLSELGGVLAIRPAQITEDVSALVPGKLYPVHVQVKSTGNPDGADFGSNDSDTRLFFLIRDRPALVL